MALLNDFVVCHIRNLFHVVTKYTLMLEISTCCIGIGWFIWGWFIFSLHAVAHKEIIRDAYHCIPENQLLVEVPLQQALKRFSMPRLVAGHFIKTCANAWFCVQLSTTYLQL